MYFWMAHGRSVLTETLWHFCYHFPSLNELCTLSKTTVIQGNILHLLTTINLALKTTISSTQPERNVIPRRQYLNTDYEHIHWMNLHCCCVVPHPVGMAFILLILFYITIFYVLLNKNRSFTFKSCRKSALHSFLIQPCLKILGDW